MVEQVWTDPGRTAFDPEGRFPFTLREEAEQLVGTWYSSVYFLQSWEFLQLLLDISASQTDAGDSLTVTVEFSQDNVTFQPVATFEVQAGDGGASRSIITFESDVAVNPDAIFITLGASAGVVDEKSIGKYIRIKGVVAEVNASAHVWGMLGYIGYSKVDLPE